MMRTIGPHCDGFITSMHIISSPTINRFSAQTPLGGDTHRGLHVLYQQLPVKRLHRDGGGFQP